MGLDLAAGAETSPSKSKSVPEKGEGSDLGGRIEAVRKVMRECSLSDPRLAPVIERALVAEGTKTDEAADWNEIAERMIRNRNEYARVGRLGLLRFGPYRVSRFFAEGIWADDGLWGYDEQRLERYRASRVGRSDT